MSYSDSVNLHNTLIASIYLTFGGISFIVLSFAILVHLKYSKFRQSIYSIILGCLICEIMIPLHYFITGLKSLIYGTPEEISLFCILNAIISECAVTILLFYNNLTMLLLFLNKLPSPVEKKLNTKENKYNNYSSSFWYKHSYKLVHLITIPFGVLHALFFYLTESYGITHFGDCFIKNELNLYLYLLGIPLFIFMILTCVYLIMNYKHNYYSKFPTLKNYSLYCFSLSICWGCYLLRFFLKNKDIESYNAINLTGQLVSVLVIIYFRISSIYIQTVLEQGDSSNKFVQAFLIFICMDDEKPDLEEFERKASIKLTVFNAKYDR